MGLGLKIGEDENRKWRFHVCVFGFKDKDRASVFIFFFWEVEFWDSGGSPPKVKIYFFFKI